MKRHSRIFASFLGILALCLVLVSCGNKGRLFIPEDANQEQKD